MGETSGTCLNALPGQEIPSVEEWAAPQPERSLVCSECTASITSCRSAIDVQGSHEHTFRNPAGYSFHVLCFSAAPGCLVVGPPTQEATWFQGYAWSFALCAACQRHLGWSYSRGESRFFGLIATRLSRA